MQSNFRNQARVFDAEQQAVRDAKARADAKVRRCYLPWSYLRNSKALYPLQ